MIEKEVKEYKRGKTGVIQRIDFNQQDKLKKGQLIYILTEQELENLSQTNNKELKQLQNQNNEYIINLKEKDETIAELLKENKKTILDFHQEIADLIKNKDEILLEKDKIIADLNNEIADFTKQLNNAINDKNTFKDTIAGLNILLGKYKNRNFLDRLLNRKPSLDKEDQKLIIAEKK